MGNDAINGGDGDDVIAGNVGDDTITASRGDKITGGSGVDTLIYAGNKSDYTFNVDDYGTLTIANIDPSLGTDSILEVETLSFDDGDLSVTSTFDGSITLTGSSVDDVITIQSNNYISGLSAEYFTNTGSTGDFNSGSIYSTRIDATINFEGDWGGALPSASGSINSTFFVSGTEYVYAGGGADVVTVAGDEASNVFGEGGDDRLFANNAGSLTAVPARTS